MRSPAASARVARSSVRRAARAVSPWVDRLGRVGQTAHGVVYVLVGLFALEAAAGVAGPPTGAAGTLTRIAQASGRPMLAILTLGLLTYAVWHGYRAVANPDDARTIRSDCGSACDGRAPRVRTPA